MRDPALVEALETRLVNAWPSLETQIADGWILRFAKGYSKRANAATPLRLGATLDDGLIEHIAAQYRAQRLRPVFRLTGLEAPDVAERLAQRGFAEFEPSYAMVAPISEELTIEPQVTGESAVTIDAKPSPQWLRQAATSYGGEKADHRTLGEIVGRIRQRTAFATLNLDERPAAWGLAVAERGFVGLYDIVVAPDLRGLGLGRQMVCALTTWGREQGATQAYLQVREANEPARALYRSLGFVDAYRYAHRVRD